MESFVWQQSSLEWANLYALLAPRIPVRGRMAFVLLLAVIWAFSWLLWRAYSVIQTPNEILVDKLGLDIPPPPLVTLEEISAKEVQISWKSADATASIQEHQIEVNGKVVGATKKTETAAVINNLRPETIYNIRVFGISTGRFQTPSVPLHVRTSPNGQDCSDERTEDVPTIRALTQRLPQTPSTTNAPSAARESIGGASGRRGTGARRPSPAGQDAALTDHAAKNADDETDESLVELSQQFQKIQQEIETVEVQLQEEDKEHEAALREKEAERDELKHKLKERDELSSDLRRQVHKAETANRAAQTEKSKKERLLDQKRGQRRKRKDDMARWEEQMAIMADEIESLKTRKGIAERKKHSDISEVRQKIDEEALLVKALEAENKEKALEIKALEEERQNLGAEEETDESREADKQEFDRDRRWRDTMANLQSQYARVSYDLQLAHQQQHLIRDRLEATRRASTYAYTPIMQPDVDYYRRGPMVNRQNRHTSSIGSSISSPRGAFGTTEPYSMNAHFNNAINASPTAIGPSFFNSANGMTLMMSADPRNEVIEEPEPLSGAPMSPRADALLPADLLGDGSSDGYREDDEADEEAQRVGSISVKGLDPKENPDSPSPGTSSSPKSFQSPQEGFRSRFDWERNSTNSPSSKTADAEEKDSTKDVTSPKKQGTMANLFSFNRQRGKTLANEPPLLGTLKPGKSQSFPRNYDEFDPSAQPRRRLSYGSNWALPGSNLLARGQSAREPERSSATRRAFPGLFSRNSGQSQSYDPFAPDSGLRGEGSPSRPSSVYSFDVLPRVSVEGQFRAWGLEKGMRNSPLAPDWSSLSRNHSRRPSIYGSTSNLSLGAGIDDEYVQPRRESTRPLQAPIGTRPVSSQRPSTPKLNPAAPSFNGMSFFAKSREKAREKAKAKEEAKKVNDVDGTSPPESRKSKDTHSIAATTSTYESRESLERSVSQYSGGTTPMGENTPSKPTFISKMARKASSNKFGSWKGQSGIFSRKDSSTPIGTPTGAGTETEDEVHNSSHEQLGKSVESMASTPGEKEDKKASRSSLGSWNFMRKSKKGDKDKKEDTAASELSESVSSERASRASVDVMTEEEDEGEIPLH